MDTRAVGEELERARADFHRLVDGATVAELRRRSDGTRWTNEQLLFHMLFGFLVVRALLPLVRGFGRLPDRWSRRFAAVLNAATPPFHVVNYLGSVVGARLLGPTRMERAADRAIGGLRSSLARRSQRQLARGMHFPVRWDPYFTDCMTVVDVYHYATQHYEHHRRQLTLAAAGQD